MLLHCVQMCMIMCVFSMCQNSSFHLTGLEPEYIFLIFFLCCLCYHLALISCSTGAQVVHLMALESGNIFLFVFSFCVLCSHLALGFSCCVGNVILFICNLFMSLKPIYLCSVLQP